MPVPITCPSCEARLRVPAALPGVDMRLMCPRCGSLVTPSATDPEPAPRRGDRTRRLTQPVRRRAPHTGRTVRILVLSFAGAACLALIAGTCLFVALTRQGDEGRQPKESR